MNKDQKEKKDQEKKKKDQDKKKERPEWHEIEKRMGY